MSPFFDSWCRVVADIVLLLILFWSFVITLYKFSGLSDLCVVYSADDIDVCCAGMCWDMQQ